MLGRVCVLTVTIILTSGLTVPAVEGKQRPRRKADYELSAPRRAAQSQADDKAVPPIMLTHNKPDKQDYLSGEVNVSVAGNQNPIIRLGLAQHGVTIVEFPASDRFFAIHPGNEELVTVEQSPSKATDHHLVLRAGSGFLAQKAEAGAMTTIIAQMRSGMVITLMIYPVERLSQQAHRCVIAYDRDGVIEARKTAGLAVNLGEPEPPSQEPGEAKGAAPSAGSTTGQPKEEAVTTPVIARDHAPAPEPVVVELERTSNRSEGKLDPQTAAKDAIHEALRNPKKFKKWTDALHGLSISTLQPVYVDDGVRLVVIAVRNLKPETVRIVPGHPDIFVETLDDKKQPLLIERVKKLRVETTSIKGAIPAGATVYYAVIYETPILGAKQQMRVAIGQTSAADEPSATEITANSR